MRLQYNDFFARLIVYFIFYFLFSRFNSVLCFDSAYFYTILINVIGNATELLTFFLRDGNSDVCGDFGYVFKAFDVCVRVYVCVRALVLSDLFECIEITQKAAKTSRPL